MSDVGLVVENTLSSSDDSSYSSDSDSLSDSRSSTSVSLTSSVSYSEIELPIAYERLDSLKERYWENWNVVCYEIERHGMPGAGGEVLNVRLGYDIWLALEETVPTSRVRFEIIDRNLRVIPREAMSYLNNLYSFEAPHIVEVDKFALEVNDELRSVDMPVVEKLDEYCFYRCSRLLSVKAPRCMQVKDNVFEDCGSLHHVTLHTDVEVSPSAFVGCSTLEVLAQICNFVTNTGNIRFQRNNPTEGITKYLLWRMDMDEKRKLYHFYMNKLRLCNLQDPFRGKGCKRVTTKDPLMLFLLGPAQDLTRLVLSFVTGVKRGHGDYRFATKEELRTCALELKCFSMGLTEAFNVLIDDMGVEVEIEAAISRGLVSPSNCLAWGVRIDGTNGDVINMVGYHGEFESILGRITVTWWEDEFEDVWADSDSDDFDLLT